MEKRMIKKLLAILMIITILSADFFILGSGLISYATENTENSYSDIHFSAYFENGGTSVSQNIKDQELKLYAEVAIDNEQAYLDDVKLSLQESNFNIKTFNGNPYDGNEIKLNRIDSTSGTVKIELGIEPILSQNIASDMILTAKVQLDAKYKNEDSLEGINATKTVEIAVNYQPDENATPELETEIITNKIFTLNDGTDKRIVQLLIKSRLNDNHYPIKETKLNIGAPKIDGITVLPDLEENDVISLGNPITSCETAEDGTIKITIQNPIDNNNQMSWNKDGYEEVIITYIYEDDLEVGTIQIETDSQIIMANGEEVSSQQSVTSVIDEEVAKGIVNLSSQITTQEMYKGQLYANSTATEKKDIEFNKETTLIISNTELTSTIRVNEGKDVFVKNDQTEIEAKTKYVSTEINIPQMLEVLGEHGNITIKNGETIITNINKETVDEDGDGNVVIPYDGANLPSELTFETGSVTDRKTGTIELKHKKVILGDQGIDRKTLQEVKELKTNSSVTGIMVVENVENKIAENFTEARLILNETMSKATLTVGNDKLLKAGETTENVSLTIDLLTNGEKYDLYKNPQITLQFPQAVENVEFAEVPEVKNVVEGDNISIVDYKWDKVSKSIIITIQGEQTTYPTSGTTQLYIPLKLNVTVAKITTTQKDNIIMTYTNANAIQYEEDTITKIIGISGPGKLVTMFNLGSKETMSSEDIVTEQVTQNAGKTITLETILFNDTDSNMENVRILGYLPTIGNTVKDKENTLETVLTGIEATGANIYYTENVNATPDSSNSDWTQELSSLTNAKMYLIELDVLDIGTYSFKTNVKIPETITGNAISYAKYQVIYDTNTEKDKTVESGTIGLATSAVATLNATIKAEVGGDILKDGDIVKEGEIIKYTVKVENYSSESLENVIVKAKVPKETIKVEPYEDAQYVVGDFYEEKDGTEDTYLTFGPITLDDEEEFQYEVRVNKGAEGTEILNNVIIQYNNIENKYPEFRNVVQEGKIRTVIKTSSFGSSNLLENIQYYVSIENMSNEVIKDYELELITSAKISDVAIDDFNDIIYCEEIPKVININEIPANGAIGIQISGKKVGNDEYVAAYAIVRDPDGNEYRSNKFTEKFVVPNVKINKFVCSPKNNTTIKQGDKVQYNINLTNIGSVNGTFKMKGKIDYYLAIEEIKLNNVTTNQSINENEENYTEFISNKLDYNLPLDVNETAEVQIICRVINTPDESKIIKSKMDIYYTTKYLTSTEEITYTLTGKLQTNGENKNIVTGYVWVDNNENGQKDSTEKKLSGIIVKAYNNSTNNYLTDEKGNIIQKVTNNNGEYTFSEIEDGSYKFIYEYDMNKYEVTNKSIVKKQDITINGQTVNIIATDAINVTNNISNLNLGIKEKVASGTGNSGSGTENPNPGSGTENPGSGAGNGNTDNRNTISGFAWVDANRDGKKDSREKGMSGVKVRLYADSTKSYLKDENGNIIEKKTDEEGKYAFDNIEKGKYIVLFQYDMEEYEPTKYLNDGDSKVVLKKIEIEGKEETFAITNIINVQSNIFNVNIGLREKLVFDLELDKYITRIVVQNNKETKSYDYKDATLAKVEIHRKRVQGSLVVLEYKIKIKNNGEVAGYAKNIVDYLPSGLTFSSELNKDWYLSGDYLHTKGLENVVINPGEEKELKLILTKTMTNENTGLINNRAEIYQDYNEYGILDIDSTPNNQAQNEDDIGSVDVIIGPSTGGNITIYIILLILNIILIGIAVKLMIRNNIIRVSNKKERR